MAVVMPATGPVGMTIDAMIGKAFRALPDGQGSFQSSSHSMIDNFLSRK